MAAGGLVGGDGVKDDLGLAHEGGRRRGGRTAGAERPQQRAGSHEEEAAPIGVDGPGHAVSYGAVTVTPPPLEVTVNEVSPWRV
jgi:hypothetical protein